MRVWLVHHYALDPSQPGGTRHHALAIALQRAGHEVLVIAAGRHYQDGSESFEYDAAGESWSEVEGIRYLRLRTAPFSANTGRRVLNMMSFGWRVVRSRSLRRSPVADVVIGSTPQPFAAWAATVVARRSRAAFVYEVRDLWPETLVAAGVAGRWHPLVLVFQAIERRCLRVAAVVVTLLPEAASYLAAQGADRGKIRWIPNGSDLEGAGPRGRRGRFRFVYAGAIGHANGLDILIAATRLLEERVGPDRFELLIYGAGRERAGLERLVSDLAVRSVLFKGAVPKRDIGPRLGEADALVMILRDSPVFRFGVSPNKLFDYMAVGRPVLFAVRAANDPVTEAGAGIRVDPSPEGVADGMAVLLGMEAPTREAMGRRARLYQQEHHRMDRLAERFAALISGVGASSRS